MEKENQRIKLTKRMLKDALLRLLEEKPIEKVRVNELCAQSGINRATFYRHYSTPRDLLQEMEAELSRQIGGDLPAAQTVQEIEAYILLLCRNIYDHAHEVKVLLRHKTEMDYTRILEEGCQELLRTRSKLTDPDSLCLMATFFAGGGYFLLRRWLLEDISKTPEEIAGLLCSFVSPSCKFL